MGKSINIQDFFGKKLLHTTALVSAFAAATPVALAAPEGGVTTSGAANILQSGNNTTINQATNRAVIRWDRFDLGASDHVNFVQPSANSITVNRIRDNKPSQIDGGITANGKIILINPNGMVFGASSQVNVGSLVATTSDLQDDDDFMAGGAVKFTRPGKFDARIINNGQITVREAGLVGLVAPHVENNGIIRARLGKVQLASGDMHTIDLAGDGLIKLEVSDHVIAQSIKNTGRIEADGGDVLITAAQARNAVDALITHTGHIQANAVGAKKGHITISTKGLETHVPRGKGTILASGTISAAGLNANEQGGSIILSADRIALTDHALVTADGVAGGGAVYVGGNYQGSAGIATSSEVFVGTNATISASAAQNGDGGTVILWSDDRTQFFGTIAATGGAHSGHGGFVEVSSHGRLDYDGFANLTAAHGTMGTMLLDPTDILIAAGGDTNVTMGTPFLPTLDDGPSVLNVTTLTTALASANVIVQTGATGTQQGDITVGTAITWGSANSLTLNAHHDIIVNNAISGQNLNLIAGNDVQLNADLSGTGTLSLQGLNAASDIGLGTAQAGVLNLDNTELAHILNGWNGILVGTTGQTGAINVGANTWNDNLTLQTGLGAVNINGAQTMGANNLTATTAGGAITVGAAITQSTGTLALNSGAGNLNINAGITKTSGTINLDSTSGIISVGAILNAGSSALNITTDGNLALNVTNALTGTGTLTVSQATAATTMGLGGGAGTVNLTAAEIGRIRDGWASLIFGRTDGTVATTVGAATWNDNVTLRNGTGAVTITGAQTLAANNLTVTTAGGAITTAAAIGGTTGAIALTSGGGDITIGANVTKTSGTMTVNSGAGLITIGGTVALAASNMTINTNNDLILTGALGGTGTLTIAPTLTTTSIGLGNAQVGTLNLDTAEIGRITNGWASLVFGTNTATAAINVGAATWNDNVTFLTGTGAINVNGAQALAANNFVATTVGGAITTSAAIGGTTGTIALTSAGGAITIGGVVTKTGGTMSVNSGNGGISIDQAVNVAAGNMTITTDVDLALNAALSGTGTLTVQQNNMATSFGLGDAQIGNVNLANAELAQITNGWASLVFGSANGTGAMNVGAYTWNDNLTLRTGSGAMTINGAQNMLTNNLTMTTDSDLNITSNVAGTGTLTIQGSAVATSMGVGDGQTGLLALADAELNRITDGWASIILGATTQTGVMNVGAHTWVDPLTLRTGTGVMTITGTQTMGANNLTLSTDGNLALNAALTGTGNLVIQTSAAGTSMGLNAAGTLNVTTAELDQITDGWNNVTFGSTAQTGAMTVGARTWTDNLTLTTAGGIITVSGAQSMGANNLTINTDGNLALNAALTGTGNLVIQQTNAGTGIGLGTGQTGALNLTDTEVAQITDGWSNVTFGALAATGAMNVGALTWNDNTQFRGGTGVITVNGTQTMGLNDLTINTNANPVINANLSGYGTLYIQGSTVGTTMGLGTTQTGQTLWLDDNELGRLLAGWREIVFGRTDGTGAVNIGANTWQYDTRFRSLSGQITVAGAQSSGNQNMTFETDSNLAVNAALSGSGTLTVKGMSAGTVLNIATGATGLNLTTAELNQIQDGWDKLVFGSAAQTGAMNIGAYTWKDNTKFNTLTGIITVSGAQTMNANNLTFETDGDLALTTGNLTGTGILTIQGTSLGTIIGVGTGQTGGLQLSATDLAKIPAGWSQVQIGRQDATGQINIGTNTWASRTTFITRGDLVLNGTTTSSVTSGTNLTFVTGTRLVNNVGAGAINPGTGRYLVYSVDAAADTLNGLTPTNTVSAQTYFSYAPGSVSETGNVYIYSVGSTKILYVQIDNKVKVYGDIVPVLSYTYMGGLQGGDTLAAALTGANLTAIGALQTDNVGVTRVITGTFSTALGYTVQFVDGTLSVSKAPITVQAAAATRIYGDANPAFSVVYTGFKNGETVAALTTLATPATTATPTTPVGTASITTGGAVADNYTFNYTPGTLTITKAPLVATVQDATKIYGNANPAFSIVYTGFKNGETNAVIDTLGTPATTATALSGVGNYAITGSGAVDNNYSFTYVSGTLSVTPAALTITADNQTRIYGDANPVFTAGYAGFRNGDTSAVVTGLILGSSATATSNVGSYLITPSSGTASNYTITFVDGTLAVTKAMLTGTVQNATRQYGDGNPGFSVVYTGFKNGENDGVIDTVGTPSTGATPLSNVGAYVITATGAADTNYDFTFVDGTLTVTRAMLTATVQNATRQYGDANPGFTVVYTGFKNGEADGVIDTLGTPATSATPLSNVGTYVVAATGAADTNYDFVYVDGTLSITKATVTATVQDATRQYGDANPGFTIVYTGFKNGENDGVIDTLGTAMTGATLLSNVGSYAITGSGAADTNYDFSYIDGSLAITKATLTATMQNAARQYGDANPNFTVLYTGFKNSEDDSVIDTLAHGSSVNPAATVGTYAITGSGGLDTNYDFVYVDGALTVTKAMLTATAQDKTREIGMANPAFTVVYTGFKNGENAGVIDTLATATTSADTASGLGDYVIGVSGAVDANYDFTYVDGVLTIVSTPPTVTIPSTVETTLNNINTQNIVTSNMFRELLPWHHDAKLEVSGYQDIFIMPESDLYDFDYSNINFLIAITDELKQRFLLGYNAK